MPFLFWWNTWFGRQLSDKQITEYLRDDKHPRHIQHALVQIGERMTRHDAAVRQWYPDLMRLATYSVEDVRNTDAWVMGQDNSVPSFHAVLLNMLEDSSVTVRGNAALSLVRFGDGTGRAQLVALLQPAKVLAPEAGTVLDTGKTGEVIHQSGLVAKIKAGDKTVEARSPITGRIHSLSAEKGQAIAAGVEIATVSPDTEQIWEALRGLYFVGQMDDLSTVRAYQRPLPDIPDRVRQQASLTEQAIRARAK